MNSLPDKERLCAVKDLVEFSDDLEVISTRLKAFSWDYDGEEFILSSHHIEHILTRFLRNELDSNTVENWANLIEGREDIGFASEQIGEVIYELANPYLTQALDKKRAQELIRRHV